MDFNLYFYIHSCLLEETELKYEQVSKQQYLSMNEKNESIQNLTNEIDKLQVHDIDIISIMQTGQGRSIFYMMVVKSLLQGAMLETSIECDTLNKKNMDLHQEMKLIEDKLKTMSLKYDNLEVKVFTSTFVW